eukprot:UN1924
MLMDCMRHRQVPRTSAYVRTHVRIGEGGRASWRSRLCVCLCRVSVLCTAGRALCRALERDDCTCSLSPVRGRLPGIPVGGLRRAVNGANKVHKQQGVTSSSLIDQLR